MEDKETITQDQKLGKLIRRCGHVLYHQTHHCQQDAVLALLLRNGPMNQKEIQQQLSVKPGSASELISKLEAKELLQRNRDEHDRRKVVLSLTEKGILIAKIHAERPEADLFSVFSSEEKAQLIALLDKLHTSWGL